MKITSKGSILIAGHYGFGNTGDEAILASILADLRSQRNDLEVVVISANPHVTASEHHVRSVYWKDIHALLDAARHTDLIMIGGGGVFVDYWGVPADTQLTEGHWGIAYYNSIGILAAMFNKPFIIHSVGVGPLLTEEGKRLTRQTFEIADIAAVRDEESRKQLISIGVPANWIRIVPDPGLYLAPNRDFTFEIFRKAGVKIGEQSVLGVCIREWGDGKWKVEVATALDKFLETYNAKAIFIPFQKESDALEDDSAAAQGVLSQMRHQDRAHILSTVHSPEIVKGLISSCTLVVGMRLHSLIFAAGAGVPVFALAYDPKVTGFMDSLGLGHNALELNQATAKNIFQMLSQIWAKPDAVKRKLYTHVASSKLVLQKMNRQLLQSMGKGARRTPKTVEVELLRKFAIKQTGQLAEKETRLKSSFEYKLKAVLNGKPWYLAERIRKIRARLLLPGGLGEKLFKKLPQRVGGFFHRTREAVRRHGLFGALARAVVMFLEEGARAVRKIIFRRRHQQMLERLENTIVEHQGFIDYFPAPWGWSTKWFQRFQQISLESTKLGGLALYGGFPPLDKGLHVFEQPVKNLFVFDGTDKKVVRRVFAKIANSNQPRLMRIESVDLGTTLEDIETALQTGFKVVYEYIDELSPEIVGHVPDMVRRRHEAILKNESVYIVATSDQLYEKVRAHRTKNFILSTNGVDVDHWRIPRENPPADLQPVLDGKLVVAYHGTLAKWVDFELLRIIADDGRYNLLLIGHEHDDSFTQSGLKAHPRVHFLGGKSYFELNRYAVHYDITLLPFRKSYMTEAVSPVKIFEYMAAQKPIVTTDLRECRKYRSCLVAKNNEEFMQLLLYAERSASNPAYLKILEREANANSWKEKTREMLRMTGIAV
ncbi:MAG TPA: polysaccharide pyruvyl transferase family protein [Anaerolineales bacterium]|nr:polysaccharide pyruvyl transferase family protein [Anaerolineales bacterium]